MSSLFSTCTPLDGNVENDVKSFMELLIDNLAGIVQYNGLQSQDIFSVCGILTDESLGSPLERLGAVNTMMLGENGEECLDHTYETFIAQVAALRLKEIHMSSLPRSFFKVKAGDTGAESLVSTVESLPL